MEVELFDFIGFSITWCRDCWGIFGVVSLPKTHKHFSFQPFYKKPRPTQKVIEHIVYDGLHSDTNLFHDKIAEIVDWINAHNKKDGG